MSEINIMDFDPSSSIKSYNFTNTAIRRFYDTIDSEQFKDEKKEKIFEYLTGEMEIVPFNDQLKRYLYEKNEKFLKNFLRPYCRRKRRLKRSEESIKAWDTQAGIPRRCSYVTFPVALDHPVAHSDVGLDILGAALVYLQLFAQRGHKDPQGGQFR